MRTDRHTTTQPVDILIVEDERVVALDLKEQLEDMGYLVRGIASTGEEAIDFAKEHHPDLVLMDIVIKGGMDGVETAARITREKPVPVVYLTAYGNESTISRALQTAPYGYLTKPFDPMNLRAAIEVALHRARSEERERELIAQLTLLAQFDSLTGVANRRRLTELGQREINRSRRSGAPLAVLFIDIDHFKQINDSFGHETGDRVLRCFAELCSALLREVDVFGRLGGDEFVAVLLDTGLKAALRVAARLRQRVSDERLVLVDGKTLRIMVSIGACQWRPGETFEQLLHRADFMMYDAKQCGRDRVHGEVISE